MKWPKPYHVMPELIDESNVLSNREVARKAANEMLEACKQAYDNAHPLIDEDFKQKCQEIHHRLGD